MGIDFSNPVVLQWAVFIPAVHIALLILFRLISIFPQNTRKGSRASDILSIEIVSQICVIYCAYHGCLGFFNLFGSIDNSKIFEDKFYERSLFVENKIVIPMLFYQLWNLFVCILHNEFRSMDSIGHHFVTSCLAYFGLYPYAQYYALFYFGVGELTTIPLNVVDAFKNIPELSMRYPAIASAARYSFAASYFIIRILYWPVVSYELFFGCKDLLQNGTAHSNFVVGFFVFANSFLTGLQFYWGYLIIKGLQKKSSSSKGASKAL